jgi:hypothetical protein
MAQTKYTDGSGVAEIWANIKNYVAAQLLSKSNVGHTHTKSQITDFPSYGTTANTICEGNDLRLSDARTPTLHTHTKSEITDFPSLATVATSGSYNDLSNKPTIPTVNNATLTIQKNGTTVKTFTANASSNVTANITVPTKTSELTNDSGFITGVTWNDVSNKPTLATVATSGSYNDLTDLPTIPSPYTPPTFTYDSSTETLTVSNTTATVFNYDSTTETLEVQING